MSHRPRPAYHPCHSVSTLHFHPFLLPDTTISAVEAAVLNNLSATLWGSANTSCGSRLSPSLRTCSMPVLYRPAELTQYEPPSAVTQQESNGYLIYTGRFPVFFMYFFVYDLIHSRSQSTSGLRQRPWLLGRWDRGFESRLRHGCLSSYFCVVLYWIGRGLCNGLSTHQKEYYRRSKQITKPPIWGGQGPYKDCRASDGWMNEWMNS